MVGILHKPDCHSSSTTRQDRSSGNLLIVHVSVSYGSQRKVLHTLETKLGRVTCISKPPKRPGRTVRVKRLEKTGKRVVDSVIK